MKTKSVRGSIGGRGMHYVQPGMDALMQAPKIWTPSPIAAKIDRRRRCVLCGLPQNSRVHECPQRRLVYDAAVKRARNQLHLKPKTIEDVPLLAAELVALILRTPQ